jgi:hypothetical protein
MDYHDYGWFRFQTLSASVCEFVAMMGFGKRSMPRTALLKDGVVECWNSPGVTAKK